MPRFKQGTMDHDGDGRPGGSLKGDNDMVKVKGAGPTDKTVKKVAPKAEAEEPKTAAAKDALAKGAKAIEPAVDEQQPAPQAAAKAPPKAEKAEKPAEPKQPKGPTQAEIEAADLEASIGRHPGGMEPPLSEDEAKAKLDAEFAAADAKGDPRWDETLAGLAVRGY